MALGQDWRYLLPHTYAWLAHTFSFVIPLPALVTSDGNLVDMTMSSSSLTPKDSLFLRVWGNVLYLCRHFPWYCLTETTITRWWCQTQPRCQNTVQELETSRGTPWKAALFRLTQEVACNTVQRMFREPSFHSMFCYSVTEFKIHLFLRYFST